MQGYYTTETRPVIIVGHLNFIWMFAPKVILKQSHPWNLFQVHSATSGKRKYDIRFRISGSLIQDIMPEKEHLWCLCISVPTTARGFVRIRCTIVQLCNILLRSVAVTLKTQCATWFMFLHGCIEYFISLQAIKC